MADWPVHLELAAYLHIERLLMLEDIEAEAVVIAPAAGAATTDNVAADDAVVLAVDDDDDEDNDSDDEDDDGDDNDDAAAATAAADSETEGAPLAVCAFAESKASLAECRRVADAVKSEAIALNGSATAGDIDNLAADSSLAAVAAMSSAPE